MAAEATGSEGLLVEGWQADKGTEGATTSVMARQQPEQRPTTNQRQQQQTAADSGRQQAVMVEGRENRRAGALQLSRPAFTLAAANQRLALETPQR